MRAVMTKCPVCDQKDLVLAASPASIHAEVRLRREFVLARLARRAPRAELKDLTEFMHGLPAPLYACSACGLLIRGEPSVFGVASYESDPNDQDLMAQLFPKYVAGFRQKRQAYCQLLRPCAEILEVGSHLGAFLTVAEEWDWRPQGLDVGRDTVAFQQARGLSVNRQVVEDASHPPGAFDAVFIWNCFEQLQHPASTLAAVHRLLSCHGLLIIRLPNAGFYRALRTEIQPWRDDDLVLHALAYNNLLGFPYLHGHTAESLTRLVSQWGFDSVGGFNSELVTMPFPDVSRRIAGEQRAISRVIAAWSSKTMAQTGGLTGPWIELVFRKIERPARPRLRRGDPRFLRRAA